MEDVAKKIYLPTPQKVQPCLQKSIEHKPYTVMAPTMLIRSANSAFEEWHKLSGNKSLGNVEGHNNPELELKLAQPNTVSAQAQENHNNTFGEGHASQLGQARQSSSLDPKLKQKRMANRAYSQKYRLKKTKYLNNLENAKRTLMAKNYNTRLEIEEKRTLLLEHHNLKLQIAALEKDRILKEVEIEKNMAEVKRLKELQKNQLQASVTSSGSLKTERKT